MIPEMRWRKLLQAIELGVGNEILQQEASRLTDLYWEYTNEFLSTRRPLNEIDSAECSAWVQTGLALTPFAGCVIKHTCDWTIAWSLIGEWTSQEIFLPPVGEWPRNGHSRNLLEEFDYIGDRPCSLGPERVLSKAHCLLCYISVGVRSLVSCQVTKCDMVEPSVTFPAPHHA